MIAILFKIFTVCAGLAFGVCVFVVVAALVDITI